MRKTDRFGLVIIGNEVLDGRRTDAHFSYTRDLLDERNISLAWSMVISDDTEIIESQLRWAFARPEPFFCCGGIGSTPDDLTRNCAANALGVGLEHHPEGVSILQNRFEGEATPQRLLMVCFPKGADLIPNPVNRVPGFSIENGYFLPGFPSMAHPMMRWVLDTCYETGAERDSATLVLPDAKEADLVYLMEQFILTHQSLGFSSLPAFTPTGPAVHLGLSGSPDAVTRGVGELQALLESEGISWTKEAPGSVEVRGIEPLTS